MIKEIDELSENEDNDNSMFNTISKNYSNKEFEEPLYDPLMDFKYERWIDQKIKKT